MMMDLSVWLRRSEATTGAEWLSTRFGLVGDKVRASHLIVVVFALISCLGFLAYGFIGLGKFVEIFIPWTRISAYIPFEVRAEFVAHFYGIVFLLVSMLYVILVGMVGIVIVAVVKCIIMTLASAIV